MDPTQLFRLRVEVKCKGLQSALGFKVDHDGKDEMV